MKKYYFIPAVFVLLALILSAPASANNGSVYTPPYEYMKPDSHYIIFSAEGGMITLDVDLHDIPLSHIPYYLPPGSRCVISRMYQTYYGQGLDPLIVIYAIGEGGNVIPPPEPTQPD